MLGGVVHLQHAAAEAFRLEHQRDGDSLVAAAFVVDIVVIGYVRTPGEFEDFPAAGSHPVAVIGVSPRNWAPLMHLVSDVEETVAIVGGVTIEVISLGGHVTASGGGHGRHGPPTPDRPSLL